VSARQVYLVLYTIVLWKPSFI